jgi:hypothetical protein
MRPERVCRADTIKTQAEAIALARAEVYVHSLQTDAVERVLFVHPFRSPPQPLGFVLRIVRGVADNSRVSVRSARWPRGECAGQVREAAFMKQRHFRTWRSGQLDDERGSVAHSEGTNRGRSAGGAMHSVCSVHRDQSLGGKRARTRRQTLSATRTNRWSRGRRTGQQKGGTTRHSCGYVADQFSPSSHEGADTLSHSHTSQLLRTEVQWPPLPTTRRKRMAAATETSSIESVNHA